MAACACAFASMILAFISSKASVVDAETTVPDACAALIRACSFPESVVIDVASSIALPAAATALAGPANLPFVPLEQGIGSGIGEGINQLTGITEPSLKQLGLATVAPIAMGYGLNLLRTGSAIGKTLNTEAPAMATQQMSGYRAAVPAKTLFDQATQQGVTVPLSKTMTALQDLRVSMSDATPAGQRAFETVLKQTGLEDLATQPGGVTPSKLQNLLADVGKLQAQASKEGGLKAGYLGQFFGALKDDLDNSGALLGQARQAFKRETVLNDIDDAISNAMFVKKGQGLQTEFSANKILNTLNKTDEGLGKFFSQSFTPKEQVEIKSLFGFLNSLPSLKPGAGQQYGSGRFFERITRSGGGGGVGAGIGFALGGVPGAAVGAGVGILAPEAAAAGKLLMQAWKMPGGRQVVKSLLTNTDGAWTPYVGSTLTSFVAGLNSTQARPPSFSGTMLQPMPNDALPGTRLSDYKDTTLDPTSSRPMSMRH